MVKPTDAKARAAATYNAATGFWLINWLRNTDTAVVHNTYRELVTLLGDGTLSARVARTVRLEDWKDAVSLAQGDTGREGKVVFLFDKQYS